MSDSRPGYTTVIHGKVVEDPRVQLIEDETIESQNSQRGDIINLQLGHVNGKLSMIRQASGEIRYQEGHNEDELQDETVDFAQMVNGTKTGNEESGNLKRNNTIKSSNNDRKQSSTFEDDNKRKSIGRKPSPMYPKIYSQKPHPPKLRGHKAQLPWAAQKNEQNR